MSILLPLLAQLLHGVLVLAAAPSLAGLHRWLTAWFAGLAPPDPRQPWRDIGRLLRKQPVVAENASPITNLAAPWCLASVAIPALLVPSFTLGMAFAPFADLLMIGGLLALHRILLGLAQLDAGIAADGLWVQRTAAQACLSAPALFLATEALALAAGTSNLDLLIGVRLEAGVPVATSAALAAVALAMLAAGDAALPAAPAEASAADLALFNFADSVRRVTWLGLIGVVLWPIGIGTPEAGLTGWALGLPAWLARLALLTALDAGLRHALGGIRAGRMTGWLALAGGMAVLAVLFVLASAARA